MTQNSAPLTDSERYSTISRVNWVCSIVDAILSIFKLGVGFLTKSPALIADGLHSLSDLATDILALILGKLAQHGPDDDHPYGHARYETIGTVILGATLIAVAIGIGYENILAAWHGKSIVPHWISLVAVAISVVGKEALFHYTMKYAKLTRSNLLEANAWHSRSDSLSSVVVFFGILGAMAGYPLLEYVAALAVAVLIGKMGVRLTWDATQDLLDRGVDKDKLDSYLETLRTVNAIDDVHMIRTRLMGTNVFIDAHIQVNPTYTVSEAHQLNDYTTSKLKNTHDEIEDVTLHIDFEPDNITKKTTLMPVRERLEEALSTTALADYTHCYLHYSGTEVRAELLYSEASNLPEDSAEQIKEMINRFEWLSEIKLYRGN